MRVSTILKKAALINFVVFLSLLTTNVYSQTTGSIGGTVIGADNLPLEGAIIQIEGTSKGAEADANGNYVILNVDVGTYTVLCRYTGLTTAKESGVRVSVDQRTKINFTLTSGNVTIDTLLVVAPRKGIDVEESGRQILKEQIDNQGTHGIQNIVAKTAGVIQDEKGSSTLNIRGGRADENLIIVDGVATTNPIDGSSTAFVSNSQMQEIAVLTGGFGAEYGNALSGVINVTTKSGSDSYSGSAEVISDALTGKWIGTQSQGYNLYNITFGGPLIPTKSVAKVINFYGGVERQFLQVESPSWIADQIFTDNVVPTNNIVPGIPQYLWSFNGRLNINLDEIGKSTNGKAKIPVQLKGGITYTHNLDYSFQGSRLKFDSDHFRYNDSKDMQIFGRLIHNISSKFFYELQFNYYRTQQEYGDPQFKTNYFLVGDTNAVPVLTTQGGEVNPDAVTGIWRVPGTPYDFYQKQDVSYIGGKLDATLALLTKSAGNHEIKFGGELRYHNLKKLSVYTPSLAIHNYDTTGGISPHDPSIIAENISTWYSGAAGNLNAYGYNVLDQFGNSIVSGDDANPRHPIIGAFYIRDKVDFKDFSFNGGVRIDYLDVNTEVLKDISNLTGADGILLNDDDYQKSKPNITISPRLGFSFPVTDKTIFVAQFGQFVQMPPLDYLYTTRLAFSQFFKASVQNVAQNPSLKPEKLTSYEVGIKQSVGDFLNLGATAYYKSTLDQIGIIKVIASPTVPQGYTIYSNSDFAVSRGLDFYLSLRRFNRVAVDISYTLLYASGTGSDPNQKLNLVNQQSVYPQFTFPLNYDQRHTGSVNIDYRFAGDNDVPKGFWGKILRYLGFNAAFNFNSGRPYTSRDLPTKAFQPSSGVATSPKNSVYWNWNFDVDFKIDKTVPIWKTNWNFYVYVTNLLNSELVNAVWEATGRPDNDGYLDSPQAQGFLNNPAYTPNYLLRINNPFNYGPPRQVRFGVKVNF